MRTPRALLVLVVLATRLPFGHAAPTVVVETHVLLTVDAMTVENGRAKAAGISRAAEISPVQPAAIRFAVPWGKGGPPLEARFEARLTSVTPEGEAVLFCESSVSRSGGTPVLASREVRFGEEGSALFEIFGDDERRLVLTLKGEQVGRAVVRPLASVGAPVKFSVAVERVDGERIVLLETNELNTWVGQSVEYSFRQGQDEGLEAVRLSLLPTSVSGDIVTIEADISGALPSVGGTVLISRRERIVASRRATSRLTATTGTPPAGYRFQVTPDF